MTKEDSGRLPSTPPTGTQWVIHPYQSLWLLLPVAVYNMVVVVAWFNQEAWPAEWRWIYITKFNTALILLALALAVPLKVGWDQQSNTRWIMLGVGLLSIALGLATLCEYAFHWDLPFEEWAVRDYSSGQMQSAPGKLAPMAALAICLLGLGMLAPAGRLFALCASIAFGIGFVSLAGYLYGADYLLSAHAFTRLSPQTSACVMVLALGMLTLHPEMALFRLFCAKGPGSTLLRVLLPASIFIPMAFGTLRAAGVENGWVSLDYANALVSSLNALALSLIIISLAVLLNRMDAARKRAEAQRDSLQELVTMCAWTKKIKDGENWVTVEEYLQSRLNVHISHGITPEKFQEMKEAFEREQHPDTPVSPS